MCVIIESMIPEIYYLVSSLISVVHLLCEAHNILDLKSRSVIENCLSAHASEHLVLVRDEQLEVDFGRSVEHRNKRHLESAV